MYHFIEDRKFLNEMKRKCSDIINRLVNKINNDGKIEVKQHLVGSGARNLITQKNNDPIDLDYNLSIVDYFEIDIKDGTSLKEYVRKSFNEILHSLGEKDCKDSKSALTTAPLKPINGYKTIFSIDLCIVYEHRESWYRLIHEKTGIFQNDRWYWNEGKNSYKLNFKLEFAITTLVVLHFFSNSFFKAFAKFSFASELP